MAGLGAGMCHIPDVGLTLFQMSGVIAARMEVDAGGAADKAGCRTGLVPRLQHLVLASTFNLASSGYDKRSIQYNL